MRNRSRLRQRRAVSTIVGAFFFLILMTGTFAAIFAAMQFQSDLVETQRSVSAQELAKAKERFEAVAGVPFTSSGTCDGQPCYKLSIDVFNQGTSPVEIVDVWVVNKTGTFPATRFETNIDDAFVPIGSKTNVLATQNLLLKAGTYDIKVVSSLGTMAIDGLIVPLDPLRIELFAIPPNIRSGGNFTLAMYVFNRGNATVLNVAPTSQNLKANPPTNPAPSVTAFTPATQISVNLEPQEDAIFTWDVKLTGAVGTSVTFTNTATGTDSVTLSTVTSSSDTTRVEFVTSPKLLFQSPELFVITPGPFGETGSVSQSQGVWGAVVVNPTDTAMTVSRVTFRVIPSTDTSNVIDTGADCGTTIDGGLDPIRPATGWSCPIRGVLQWAGSPVTVPARDVAPFMVQLEDGNVGQNEPAVLIVITVFSSFGTFAKTGIITGMRDGGGAIANVFLTGSGDPLTTPSNILGNKTAIPSGSTQTFKITMAEFSIGGDAGQLIAASTKIIINVPVGFTNVVVNASSGFTTPITPESFPDGSTQISTTLSGTLGGSGSGQASITFTTTAPTVSAKALYTMFVLADGSDGNSPAFPVASTAEIALQVLP